LSGVQEFLKMAHFKAFSILLVFSPFHNIQSEAVCGYEVSEVVSWNKVEYGQYSLGVPSHDDLGWLKTVDQ